MDINIVYTEGDVRCLKWSLYEEGVIYPKASSYHKRDLVLIAKTYYPKGTIVSVHYVNGEIDQIFTVGE